MDRVKGVKGVRFQRLRAGELIVGASAVALLVFMIGLKWFGAPARSAAHRAAYSVNGWQGLTHVRWLMLLTIALSLGLVVAQVVRRAPALPVAMSVIVTVLGTINALVLIYRALIDVPGTGAGEKAGAFLGLVSSLGIAAGAYMSLRREGISQADGPGAIERVAISCDGPGTGRDQSDSIL